MGKRPCFCILAKQWTGRLVAVAYLTVAQCCTCICPQELIYGGSEAPTAVGVLQDSSKPLLFTMARLDRVKNLTGLVEW